MADEAKAKGNAAFAAGNFSEAITHFTEAISIAPNNHILYSNRSAAYASLNKFTEALVDAQKTVELKPDWPKGYSRLGAAHLGLNQPDESIAAYQKGLDIDPNNEALKYGLADAKSAQGPLIWVPSAILSDDTFKGEEMWIKLASVPITSGYLQQPSFVRKMQDIQENPSQNLRKYFIDPRIRDALTVLWGVKVKAEISVTSGKSPEEGEAEPEPGRQKIKDPNFAEGYIGKGAVHFSLEEYEEALETYQEGLRMDPENLELQDGLRRCVDQMNKASLGDLTPEELEERQENLP